MSQPASAISFPADAAAAAALLRAAPASHLRAGGTDLQERRHLGVAPGALIDLRDAAGMDQIAPDPERPGALLIGARCRIQAVADAPLLRQQAPLLALAAGALATPQIRAVGTLGGNLAQHTRCWYYRSPDWSCIKKGGAGCPAVEGDHRWHAVFPHTGCAAVHASTLAVALLAADAEIQAGEVWTSLESWLSGPGGGSADQSGGSPALIRAVRLAVSLPDERVSYHRAISRARAEWPLVECAVRLRVEGGAIRLARVAVGAVAAVPMRLRNVEAALEGQPPTPELLAAAAARATDGAQPLPGTQYKLALLSGCVLECLERALA